MSERNLYALAHEIGVHPVRLKDALALLGLMVSKGQPGFDIPRLAEAVAQARGRSYVDMLDTATATKIAAAYDLLTLGY